MVTNYDCFLVMIKIHTYKYACVLPNDLDSLLDGDIAFISATYHDTN